VNPVTHLLVNTVNHDAGPVVPPAVKRTRRRSPFRRIRRLLAQPTYRWYLREP
jgi:hypothetical protein